MYAIIKTGGKQYQVAVGDKLKVEQLNTSNSDNNQIILSEVLMIVDGGHITIGSPLVNGATVAASIVSNGRHKKIRIFKMRRRKHYQRHQGHRQNYTEIEIKAINC